MKVTVQVGSVVVQTRGLDLSRRDVRQLLKDAASIAVALAEQAPEPVEEKAPLGFTAHLERLADDLAAEPGGDED